MFKVNDIVVSKHDICKITEIIKDFAQDEDYYTLAPLDNDSLTIHAPVSNKMGLLRSIITKQDAKDLIQKIPEIKIVKLTDRTLEHEYNSLVNSGKREDLVRVIKTTYLHKIEGMDNGLKMSQKEKSYFALAERLLYSELSVALNKPYSEMKEYIVDIVSKSYAIA